MKNTTKRTIAAFGAATMLISGGIISATADDAVLINETTPAKDAVAISTLAPSVNRNYLIGSIKVGKSESENKITSSDGQTEIYKSDATIVLDADGNRKSLDDITEGKQITFYTDANAPMTLQYPPCYSADVIVIEESSAEIPVSRVIGVFDEELLDEELDLQLIYNGKTPYYSATKDIFHGGKALVFYDKATLSLPAQATPIAIVKLNDDAVQSGEENKEEEALTPEKIDLSAVKNIVVKDTQIAYVPVTVNGVSMVPVRSVAEALGYEVAWNDENKAVTMGHAYFKIDEDSYVIGKRMPDSLGQAPVLIALPGESNALTYVPAEFFTDVLGCDLTLDGENAVISQFDGE